MRFQNAAVAGRELAVSLNKLRGANDTIVIAVVSGGVFVAAEVARELQLPFELLFIRRLLAPFGPQNVLCAMSVAGNVVVDDELSQRAAANEIEYVVADGIRQLTEGAQFCRDGRPPVDLHGKRVVLVDNGIHTGSTVLIAIRAVRKLEPKEIVVAVPVADPASRDVIEQAADAVVCLAWPEKFGHVGLWYEEFVRPTDEQILRLYLAQ